MSEICADGPRVYDPLTRRQLTRTQTDLFLAAAQAPRIRVWRTFKDAGAIMIEGAPRTWRRQTFNAIAHLFVKIAVVRPRPTAAPIAADFKVREDLKP